MAKSKAYSPLNLLMADSDKLLYASTIAPLLLRLPERPVRRASFRIASLHQGLELESVHIGALGPGELHARRKVAVDLKDLPQSGGDVGGVGTAAEELVPNFVEGVVDEHVHLVLCALVPVLELGV